MSVQHSPATGRTDSASAKGKRLLRFAWIAIAAHSRGIRRRNVHR